MLEPMDISRVKTSSINDAERRVNSSNFAKAAECNTFEDFYLSLPDVLSSKDLREVCRYIALAREEKRTVLVQHGGHVIKTGCGVLLGDLIRRGFITALAVNGSAIIHDIELSYFGQTSEDVAKGLLDGSFGMVRETAQIINNAIRDYGDAGYGEAIKKAYKRDNPKYSDMSLISAVVEMDIPLTVHIAIGTDIVHQHPSANGAEMGNASYIDWRRLVKVVSTLSGGAIINIGSAVILPEVFLKALTVARNLGYEVGDFMSVNMDMIQHYRPCNNIVERPTQVSGRGISLTGHHEIMIPLLRMGILYEAVKISI